MISLALIDTALAKLIVTSISKVTTAKFSLYSGLSAATLTITATPPTVNYRCVVTLANSTTHTDCAGTVVVAGETLTFSAAGTKLCTVTVTANTRPVVTSSGLDCGISITCRNTAGQDIMTETVTTIKARWQDSTSQVQTAGGVWTASQAIVFVTDSTVTDGSILRRNSLDYVVQKTNAYVDINGVEKYRKCYLGTLGW